MSVAQKKFDGYLSNHLSQINNTFSSSNRKEWLKYNYKNYFPTNFESKILEIGPGFGELLLLLYKDFGYINVKAVDLSQEVVDFCNTIAPESTELTTNTVSFLKANQNQFDIVFMLHVLEHIPKDDAAPILSEIFNALKSEGTLIIEVPNMANPMIGLNLRYSDFTHEVGFTDISLKQVLYKAGFSNVSVFPSKVPIVSTLRFFQAILQKIFNQTLNLLTNIYLPGKTQIMSPSIFAIATKT